LNLFLPLRPLQPVAHRPTADRARIIGQQRDIGVRQVCTARDLPLFTATTVYLTARLPS
jgi:hypothetical protein